MGYEGKRSIQRHALRGVKVRICRDCLRPFEEYQNQDYDPARELGDIFLKSTGIAGNDDLCPECRDKLGMLNLMGFLPMKPG